MAVIWGGTSIEGRLMGALMDIHLLFDLSPALWLTKLADIHATCIMRPVEYMTMPIVMASNEPTQASIGSL